MIYISPTLRLRTPLKLRPRYLTKRPAFVTPIVNPSHHHLQIPIEMTSRLVARSYTRSLPSNALTVISDSPCDRCLDHGRECISSATNNATACDPCRKLKKKCSHSDAAPTGAHTRTRRPARKRRAVVSRESEDELGPETSLYFASNISEGFMMETRFKNVLKNVERYPDMQSKAREYLNVILGAGGA